MKRVVQTNHHSLFCRTLRAMSEGGFFTTIQNITVVATDKAYLFQHDEREHSGKDRVGVAARVCLT